MQAMWCAVIVVVILFTALTLYARNHTWYHEEIYKLLRQYNCAFCIYELESPMVITADFVYVRLHGPTEFKYQGSYNNAALKKWAKQCLTWQKEKRDVYVYFDNDQEAYAAFNALRLKKFVAKTSIIKAKTKSLKKVFVFPNIIVILRYSMGATKSFEFTTKENKLAKTAKALAHPARIAILRFLSKKQSCMCGDIVEELPLSQSTVSQHLKELKEAGLITGEIEGAKVCYCIDEKQWKAAQAALNQLFDEYRGGSNCC